MCLAIPGIIREIEGNRANVDFGGIMHSIALDLVTDARMGDYILAHAGFALQILDPVEASEIIATFEEMEALDRQQESA